MKSISTNDLTNELSSNTWGLSPTKDPKPEGEPDSPDTVHSVIDLDDLEMDSIYPNKAIPNPKLGTVYYVDPSIVRKKYDDFEPIEPLIPCVVRQRLMIEIFDDIIPSVPITPRLSLDKEIDPMGPPLLTVEIFEVRLILNVYFKDIPNLKPAEP